MKYRREIDGLRALAVTAVILSHTGSKLFRGGFVGVDVFFVISGYLITCIVQGGLQTGSFSLLGFYERRARRILPALFFVMAASLVLAWVSLPPADMKGFSNSLVAVSVFASNFLFWQESGYFDTEASLKPLLHTWSLSVEEQFYVFYPMLMMVLWRFQRRQLPVMLAIIGATSLALAQWQAYHAPSAGFFLMGSRAWELLVGASAALILSREDRPFGKGQKTAEIAGATGLVMILCASFLFDDNTPFPSLYALLPTLGTALVILFANQRTLAGKLLGRKTFVGIGLISYSAYLWHQPLFAYARHLDIGYSKALTAVSLCLIVFGLSWLSWRFVEQPFRRSSVVSTKMIFLSAIACSLSFVAVGVAGNSTDGFIGRYEQVIRDFPMYELDAAKLQKLSWSILQREKGEENYRVDGNESDQILSFSGDTTKTRVLFVGNSHSKDLFNVFYQNRDLFPHMEFARYGFQIFCLQTDRQKEFFDSPNYNAADVVIVSHRWSNKKRTCLSAKDSSDSGGAKALAMRGAKDGKLVVLTSDAAEFPQTNSFTLADKMVLAAVRSFSGIPDLRSKEELQNEINRRYFDVRNSKAVDRANDAIRQVAAEFKLIFLDKNDFLCETSRGVCFAVIGDFQKSFFDSTHYTLEGAKMFGQRAARIGWLCPVEKALRWKLPHAASTCP